MRSTSALSGIDALMVEPHRSAPSNQTHSDQGPTAGLAVHVAEIGGVDERFSARSTFLALQGEDSVRRHRLTDDPQEADAIMVVDLHRHPEDPLLRSLSSLELVREFRDKVFVYDERAFPTYTYPGIYVGAPRNWTLSLPVVGGPYPLLHNASEPTTTSPDLLFSFRGGLTHTTRHQLLALSHRRAVIESTGTDIFRLGSPEYHDGGRGYRARYSELIHRSKFVLCPRGHSPSSFRMYETLTAGRVPVIISDAWLAPPGIPWDACSVRVPETAIPQIPTILEDIEDRWPDLAANALLVSAAFRGDRLWDHYASSIAELQRLPRPRSRPWVARVRDARVRARLARDRAFHVGGSS